MKTGKKVISMLMSLCLVLLPACSGGDGSPTDNAQTTAGTTENLDNEIDYSAMAEIDKIDDSNVIGTGSKYDPSKTAGHVHALCYYDLTEAQPELVEILAQRFGGTIDTEIAPTGSGYYDKLGQLVSTGNSPDIVRYDWVVYPDGISKNMYTPLDEWLDMDSELWVNEKSVIESFNYAGKHYYYPSDVNPNFVILYNQATIDEAGLDSPLELYKSNNWTWDTFKELTRKWCDQSEEHIGFTGGSWTGMMLINSTGVKTIDMTGTEIINNFKNPDAERAMSFFSDMKKNGLIGDGFVGPGEAFTDGNLLFLAMGLTWGFESAQQSFFNIGSQTDKIVALPLPRDPQSEKYYMAADTFGFLVPAGAPNIQGGVSWILSGRIYETDPETKAADYAKKTDATPQYYDKCPGCKYNFPENNNDSLTVCPECDTARKPKFKAVYDDEQMQIIYDMKDGTKFDFVFDNVLGFGDTMNTIVTGAEESIFDGPLYYAESSFTSLLESKYQSIEAIIQPYRDELAKAVTQ